MKDEQERQDKFIDCIGGVEKADRIQYLWNNSYPKGTEYGRVFGQGKTKEQAFTETALNEGFTPKQINRFLEC